MLPSFSAVFEAFCWLVILLTVIVFIGRRSGWITIERVCSDHKPKGDQDKR
jgi:hypothetical protein